MKDYKALGFKCGLEIHQQLDTRKLYSGAPSIVHDTDHTIEVRRRLRPSAGESGKIDAAALHEKEKNKYFVYTGAVTSAGLVELDEEPPQPMCPEALETALQVCKMLNMTLVDEIHVMRKIVVDGSNTSGFQRTALIGINGFIETSKGKVTVESVCLEEESAQKVEDKGDHVVYRLDRLGVPLIEIATGPDLVDPEHAKEAAEKLGMILRSTGRVKRGIGTIRQDVNVSVKGGSRVEIKGFQDLKSILKILDYEVERQLGLQEKGEAEEPHVRKACSDNTTSFLRPMPGANRMYPETDVAEIRVTQEMLSKVEIPQLIDEKIEEISGQYGIDKDLAGKLIKEGKDSFFVFCMKRYGLKGAFIADTLLSSEKQIKKQFDIDREVSQESFSLVFKALSEEKIAKDALLEILKSDDVASAIDANKLMSDSELEATLKEIVAANNGMPFKALIGKAMGQLRGKASGKKIMEMLKQLSS